VAWGLEKRYGLRAFPDKTPLVTEQGVVVVPKAEPPETFHGRP
jgi:hypothetical protein